MTRHSVRALLLLCGILLSAPSQGQVTWNPDYNGDGVITAADLTGFLMAWEMGVAG